MGKLRGRWIGLLAPALYHLRRRYPFSWMLCTIYAAGILRFEAANFAHFPLLEGRATEISTGYVSFPEQPAMLRVARMGASAATLYIEDDAETGRPAGGPTVLERRLIIFARYR